MKEIINATANRPDVSMAYRIRAVFGDDPDISIDIDTSSSSTTMTMLVNNSKKAYSLKHLLNDEYEYGGLKLVIDVIDTGEAEINSELIRNAFEGNPHFKEYKDIIIMNETFHVCLFNKEVIQFQNNNGGSLHGFETRVMEDLAREVMPVPKLLYSTDDGIN